MLTRVAFCGRAVVAAEGLSADDVAAVLQEHFSQVMDELINIEERDADISTPDISAKLATGEVEISVNVEGSHPEEAFKHGLGVIRTAVHAAGGCTEGWDQVDTPSSKESTTTWVLEFEGTTQRRDEVVDA